MHFLSNRRIPLALLSILFACTGLHAQNEIDALRYNTQSITGTARSIAMGGAFSAVGADYSAATLNPAGLALYRRSDLMFTPRVRFTKANAEYIGVEEAANTSKFGFANIGYVNAARIEKWDSESLTRKESEKGLKSYAFSIGVNQLANFQRQTRMGAYNASNSITDYFASLANGQSSATVAAAPGLAGSAWGAYLIDTSGTDNNYVPAALGGQMQQDITILESGRINEWNLALAGNLEDMFYGGVSVGIQDLKYSSEHYHDESDINDVHNTWANDSTPLASVSYTDIYDTKGTGINVRLGFIFRPSDFFRLGFSFQSPTITSMTDEYVYELKGSLDDAATEYGREPESGTFEYNLSTPYKVTVGAMAMLRKLGFVSMDFDYLDYSSTSYATPKNSTSFYDFRAENRAIRDIFRASYNLRLGAEARMNKARFRLGYAMYGAVLKDDYLYYTDFNTQIVQKLMPNRHFLTGGLGYKQESFYLDIAYSRELSADRRLYYTVQDLSAYSPELIRRTTSGNFYMTIGFTF